MALINKLYKHFGADISAWSFTVLSVYLPLGFIDVFLITDFFYLFIMHIIYIICTCRQFPDPGFGVVFYPIKMMERNFS